MTLPKDIDLPCKIIQTPIVDSAGLLVKFEFEVIEGRYRGEVFASSTELPYVARSFPEKLPQLHDAYIIKKRGNSFEFGPRYEPLNIR